MTRAPLRAAAAAAACLVLASCRVDTGIGLSVGADGSGTVTVTVTADADVVRAAPSLKSDLRVDDLTSAGWKVVPADTDTGGLTVEFSHPFNTPEEATALLGEVNGARGPLKNLVLARSGKVSNSTFTLTGTLEVNGGLEAFADDAALKLLGGAPYQRQVTGSGLDLGKAVGIEFTAVLPGTLVSTTGTAADGTVTWRVPTDGTPADVATVSNNVDIAANVAGVVKWIVAVLGAVWVAGSLALFGLVARRTRRTPRP